MNDTMNPQGLVPTLLVFGALPSLPINTTDLPAQRLRLTALLTIPEEMATIVDAQRIRQAITARLPPVSRYAVAPGSLVSVHHEGSSIWEGPFLVRRASRKQAWIVDLKGPVWQFSLAELLSEPTVEDYHLLRMDNELLRSTGHHAKNRTVSHICTQANLQPDHAEAV